jgi:hypothetical protein
MKQLGCCGVANIAEDIEEHRQWTDYVEGEDGNKFSNNMILTSEKKRLLEDLKEDSIGSSGLKFYSGVEENNTNR